MDTGTQITTLRSRLFSVALGVGLLLASQLYDAGSTAGTELIEESKIEIGSVTQSNLRNAAIDHTEM